MWIHSLIGGGHGLTCCHVDKGFLIKRPFQTFEGFCRTLHIIAVRRYQGPSIVLTSLNCVHVHQPMFINSLVTVSPHLADRGIVARVGGGVRLPLCVLNSLCAQKITSSCGAF